MTVLVSEPWEFKVPRRCWTEQPLAAVTERVAPGLSTFSRVGLSR